MSSRQRKRLDLSHLKLQSLVQDADEDEEDVESEEEEQKPQFVAFSESESSEAESESDLDISSSSTTNPKNTAKKQTIVNEISEDELLDSIIAQTKAETQHNDGSVSDTSATLLQVDATCLDIDHAQRNRFHGQFREAPTVTARARQSRLAARKTSRKYLFSQPKLDWPKPVAYINGGMQMVKSCENTEHHMMVFRFDYSAECYHIHKMYEIIHTYIQDPNTLLMFSINFPHSIPALLAVSDLFFKSNMHERGVDNIRRALYVYEHTFLEQFATKNSFSGKINPFIPTNQLFFDTLYRYLCICIRQQYWSVALQVLNMLLIMNPTDDTKACLLHLDFVLLMSTQYGTVIKLCGLEKPVGMSLEEFFNLRE
ncbi:hypothetical protein EON65_51915 [archaeon]|nr:MAG: hypothetical protein EON65_51915 [archaeon]